MESNSKQKIDEKIYSFMKNRLHKMGNGPSGLYNYYIQRLLKRELFSKEDKEIIKYVKMKISPSINILEVGGGLGQIGHSLSLLGYYVDICESDGRRYEVCFDLGKALDSKAIILKKRFPGCYNKKYGLIVIANIVGSGNNLKKDLLIFKEKTLNTSKILFAPGIYDENTNYEDSLLLFQKLDIKYQVIGNGVVLI